MHSEGPEHTTEPRWPTWARRTAEWVATEARRGVCECPWVEPKAEDLALYGMASHVLAVCVDCGAVWERDT